MHWSTVRQLVRESGDLYLIDLPRFVANLSRLRDAFTSVYPKTTIAFAVKANHTPVLCRAAVDAGMWVEVSSGLEFDLMRTIGIPGDSIIVNGPRKDIATMRRMAQAGSLIVVDSLAMASDVASIAELAPRVLVRLHLDGGPESRFGVGEEDLSAVLTILLTASRVEGFSYHYSGDRTPAAFAKRSRSVVDLAMRHFGEGGPQILDLGGGLSSQLPATLRGAFPNATYADYGEAIAGEMSAAFGDQGPRLIIEPGTAVVADCVHYAVEVTDSKTLDGVNYAVVAGAVHSLKPTRHKYQMPYRVLPGEGPRLSPPVRVVGDSCMESDMLIPAHPAGVGVGV